VSGFWAAAPDDVWAWGGTEVMRWNGRTWTRVDVPVKQTIRAIWGTPNDVSLRAWDYTPWSIDPHLIKRGHVDTSLLHWDNHQWSIERRRMDDDRGRNNYTWPPPFVQSLAPPPDAARIVGRAELIALWKNHGGGRTMPEIKTGYRAGAHEIWATSEDGYRVAHFDGEGWAVGERLTTGNFSAVRMTGAADGWAVSRSPWPLDRDSRSGGPPRDGLFRWDGRTWQFVRSVPARTHALWASAPADVWAVGERGLVLHWDGGRWSEQHLTGDLRFIWGRSGNDVWINDCADGSYHWNGSVWNRVRGELPHALKGSCLVLGGASATDVVALARHTLVHWNGAAWVHERTADGDQVPLKVGASISALWSVPSSGDLWAVGAEGVGPGFDGWPLILRRSAGAWSQFPTPRTEGAVLSVWGDRDDDVWAVGTKGLVLHWDGTAWSQEDSGVVESLRSVHGTAGTAWIVGDRGTVLVRAIASRAAR
jgi:hypothetical protein